MHWATAIYAAARQAFASKHKAKNIPSVTTSNLATPFH